MMKGIFITFEGIEGSGKSTQLSMLNKWLTNHDYDVVATREPGGTRIGEKIRELLRSGSKDDVFSPRTELMLFEASRAQHMEEIVLPALNNGKIVLCDRFFDSTTVYQGVARAIDTDIVHILNDFSSFEKKPDLTIILDIGVDESMNRLIERETSRDRIEQEDRKFFENVRNGYLSLAQNNERFFVIDGTGDANNIQQKIRDELSKRFFVR
jgi:dTMP kinase